MFTRSLALTGAAVLAVAGLTGCSSSSDTATGGASSPVSSTCPITVADPWVKSADSGMTAAFGTLTNTGTTDVTVVSGTSDAAGMVELHEVVDVDGKMVMQPKQGGFVVPAGGTHELAPGGDHIMLMQLPAPVEAGQTVAITMTCSDGGTAPYSGVAKPFEGGGESYMPMDGMQESPSPMQS